MGEEQKMGKALRWLGFLPGKGVLHIKRADGKVEVVPAHNPEAGIQKSCIIRDPMNLAALGEERITEFIRAGQAEWVKLTDGIFDFLHPEPNAEKSIEIADVKQAQTIAQDSADFSQKAADQNAEFQTAQAGKSVAAVAEMAASDVNRRGRRRNVLNVGADPIPAAADAGPK